MRRKRIGRRIFVRMLNDSRETTRRTQVVEDTGRKTLQKFIGKQLAENLILRIN